MNSTISITNNHGGRISISAHHAMVRACQFMVLLYPLALYACSKSSATTTTTTDTFTVGSDYPVQERGYVCSDEASLLKAKNDFDSGAQFIAQSDCVQISFGDTLTITAVNDPYLAVQISSGMNRGVSTTGYSGLTFPTYLSSE